MATPCFASIGEYYSGPKLKHFLSYSARVSLSDKKIYVIDVRISNNTF